MAHEYVKNGGSYVIVLGKPLSDPLIARRQLRVFEEARSLALLGEEERHRVRVYDANAIARWASLYPSLAVSALFGGPGSAAIDLSTWAASRDHTMVWTPDDSRAERVAELREGLSSSQIVDYRIQGDSGVGKTRLALETLSDPLIAPLVAYVTNIRELRPELVGHLIREGRTAILVIDDCPPDEHVKVFGRLPDDPRIKLITIGQPGPAVSRSPVVEVSALAPASIQDLLRISFPSLSVEARRFVGEHANGNPRWAEIMARRVLDSSDSEAAELITKNDLDRFVSTLLPEGRDFFIAAGLALFERVGWQDEKSYQLETIARFLAMPVSTVQEVGLALNDAGLLSTYGRYRALGPLPLSVHLAAHYWRTDGPRIVSELLPECDDEMTRSLFRRAADLGRYEPLRDALRHIIGPNGMTSSLSEIEAQRSGQILTQLAIVLPQEMSLALVELIEGTSEDELRNGPACGATLSGHWRRSHGTAPRSPKVLSRFYDSPLRRTSRSLTTRPAHG